MTIIRNKSVSEEELQALFDEFESVTRVVDGRLSYTEIRGIDNFSDILPDAFTVSPPLPRTQAIKLFAKALRDARRAGPLSGDNLLHHALRIYSERRERRLERFTLWTKVRGLAADGRAMRFEWGAVTITVTPRLPRWLHLDPHDGTGLGMIDPAAPVGSAYAIMACDERDEEVAVNRMLDALQLVMSLINTYESRGRWTWMAGRRWTAGKMTLGPHHFVFKGRAFQGRTGTWYNPRYDLAAWQEREPPMSEYVCHARNVRLALKALADHPLRTILVSSLMLKQDGFEATDGNHRLLRFWAALERIYVPDGGRGQSNKQVIQRAAFADSDPRLTSWQLRHVSQVRNEWVHARGHDGAHMSLGQELKDILTRHLLHWIFDGRRFPSHKALLAYVDLPRDDAELLAMRAAIDRRLALNRERDG